MSRRLELVVGPEQAGTRVDTLLKKHMNLSGTVVRRIKWLEDGILLDGRAVDMGGILTEVKGKATKKGAYMGFVTLEDLTGQIECLVFPKVYERYQGMMAADDLVVLSGKLSIREEEAPKLLVDRVVPLEEWKNQPAERPAPRPPRLLPTGSPNPSSPTPRWPSRPSASCLSSWAAP